MYERTPTIEYPSIDWNATPTEQLPRLPGEIGPPAPSIEWPGGETESFERVEFPAVVEEPCRYAGWSKNELYYRAKQLGIPRRSRMTKAQLLAAVRASEG